jgi:predicted dehydrogenase
MPTLALIGANGHGMWHRRIIAPLHESGRLRLVGLSDVRPIEPAPGAGIPSGARLFNDHRELLAEIRPDVAVICTPPHTHLAIATDALRSGCDILLEKPPVLSLAEHRSLAGVLAGTGRACQVGFQALGSAALVRLVEAIGTGALGTVTAIGVAGSWQRDDAYYARSPWAGRRSLNGQAVLDGALANPFAHALMQALAIAIASTNKPDPRVVEVERYRARPIEVDDTACLRVTLDSGLPVTVAVTLCGEGFIAGEVIVDGTAGRAVLEYPTDRLQLPGEPAPREVPGRVGLLENLLDHWADRSVPLVAPLSTTEPFTKVLEAIQAAPEPALVDDSWLKVSGLAPGSGAAPARHVTVVGVNDAIQRAVRDRALFSELPVPWATAPHQVLIPGAGPVVSNRGLKTHCK